MAERPTGGSVVWHLKFRLYIAGYQMSSVQALAQLNKLCQEHFAGRCQIEVVDVRSHPERAKMDHIVVLPTLEREAPPASRRLVGSLNDEKKVIAWMSAEES